MIVLVKNSSHGREPNSHVATGHSRFLNGGLWGEVFLVEFVRILVEVDRSCSFFRLFLGFSGCCFLLLFFVGLGLGHFLCVNPHVLTELAYSEFKKRTEDIFKIFTSPRKINMAHVKITPLKSGKSPEPNLHYCVQNVNFPGCLCPNMSGEGC